MKWNSFQGAALGLSLSLLCACAGGGTAPKPEPLEPVSPKLSRKWDNERIYFALTDRFFDGNANNNAGVNRADPLAFHGGDWDGLSQKLEAGYFTNLGFTALWISPLVLQQGAGYHGYWAENFLEPDPHFGSLNDLRKLVKAAHDKGIKVIQDVVVNHAGYGSSLVTQHPTWFPARPDCYTPQAPNEQDCRLSGLPDFDTGNPEAKKYLDDAVRSWLREAGIDGIRMDTMKHVPDAYWRDFFRAGGAGDPASVWTVGEIFNTAPGTLARYMDDLGSPSVFDFALQAAVRDTLSRDGDVRALASTFALDGTYQDARRLTTFIDNHDMARFVSSVGSAGQVSARLDLALSLIFTARGTPSVYYGTEIAMPGKGDPFNHRNGDSSREDMRFDGVTASPTAARLTALNGARAAYPALSRGVQSPLWTPEAGQDSLLAFRRTLAGQKTVVVVLNNGASSLDLSSLPGGGLPLQGSFAAGATLTEVTGRTQTLSVNASGLLVGTVPPRTLLAVAADAGTPGGVNPSLPSVTGLAASAQGQRVNLTWTPLADPSVQGYRVYRRKAGETPWTLLTPVPLPRSAGAYLTPNQTPGTALEFRVVTVDAGGQESAGTAVPFSTPALTTRYALDGDLSDWATLPTSRVLSSPQAGAWGGDNNLQELRLDADAQYLYLGVRARAEANNPVIVYLDLGAGGATSAAGFSLEPRKASFPSGVDYFVFLRGTDEPKLYSVNASGTVTPVPDALVSGSSGVTPVMVRELALSWSKLGGSVSSARVFAGIFGGEGYGGGEQVPNASSSPAGNNTNTGSSTTEFAVTFTQPWTVDLTP